jgi:hypothetical protein
VPDPPTPEFRIRSSRAVGFVALAIGGAALALAVVWPPLRRPFWLVLFAIAILVGVWRILDRRVRLAISAEGIRYADWGRAVVPWEELSGYAWTSWRQNRYLQVIPRRPTQLVATFSPLGRLAHLFAGWIRMPRFAIAVTPLDIGEAALDAAISRHLPRSAPLPG